MLKPMESGLGKRGSPDQQEGRCDVNFERCCGRGLVRSKRWVERGAIIFVQKYVVLSVPGSAVTPGTDSFAQSVLSSYRKKLLFICRYVVQSLKGYLED